MSGYEPSPMEIRLTLSLGTLAGSFYKRYVDRLELTGAEQVLDFGSGSGVCSRFLARGGMQAGDFRAVLERAGLKRQFYPAAGPG